MKTVKMKTIKIVLSTLLACSLFAFTSGDKAPLKVTQAFSKKFPTVKKVKWDKESATQWEAEFKMNKVEYSANFLEDGTWQETEHEISKKDIPATIKTALMAAFPGYEIEEAEISETPKELLYEFMIEKGEIEMEVAINANGTIVKQEVKNDKEDKD
ncbi:PepSY-like domain-containing protein [Polaribacter glomeratus]|nr:PepSY-like domain-containing protein [Polaribacter glomeratus]